MTLWLVVAPARADESTTTAGERSPSVPTWRDRLTLTVSERARGEFVDWFTPAPEVGARGANRYGFFANQLRLGTRVTFPHVQLTLELQHTELANLPDDASLPAPQGNLGPGAIYFANTRSRTQGELFLKKGFLTFRRRGLTASIGRLEYRDGLEAVPADATLSALKRSRIAERLIGPFDFTHVTRSFDGGLVAYDDPDWNATALALRPTQGGFEVSANREITDIGVAGLAVTRKRLFEAVPAELRAFYLYYDDRRDDVLKVDNRPLDRRRADHDTIAIHTIGGHALAAIDVGPGIADALLWTALQLGDWGDQEHGAWAYALEAGYQLPRVVTAPWLRIGLDRSSGDDDPEDDEHRTFFQMLPTARIYAQLPFYNLMNSSDLFLELLLRPHERVGLRVDYHWLSLTEGRDLWYSGGGATKDHNFGFAGSPAGGHHRLADLVDVSISIKLTEQLTLNTYYGHAFGAGVVRESFAGEDADYGFVELVFKN